MDYIKEINGEIIHPEYYPGLSRDFIAKSFYETIVSNQKPNSLIYGEEKSPSVQLSDDKLSTKADTLLNISPILQKSIIEETFVFTVSEWRENKNSVLSKIKDKFRKRKIVVRSSSQSEDLLEFSSAGLYRSKLNVESNDLCK